MPHASTASSLLATALIALPPFGVCNVDSQNQQHKQDCHEQEQIAVRAVNLQTEEREARNRAHAAGTACQIHQVRHEDADDLGKAERRQRQIDALDAKARIADDNADGNAHQDDKQQRKPRRHRKLRTQQGARIRAERHNAGGTEVHLSHHAGHKVQTHQYNDADDDLVCQNNQIIVLHQQRRQRKRRTGQKNPKNFIFFHLCGLLTIDGFLFQNALRLDKQEANQKHECDDVPVNGRSHARI